MIYAKEINKIKTNCITINVLYSAQNCIYLMQSLHLNLPLYNNTLLCQRTEGTIDQLPKP